MSAASSPAVGMAPQFGITLIGFTARRAVRVVPWVRWGSQPERVRASLKRQERSKLWRARQPEHYQPVVDSRGGCGYAGRSRGGVCLERLPYAVDKRVRCNGLLG